VKVRSETVRDGMGAAREGSAGHVIQVFLDFPGLFIERSDSASDYTRVLRVSSPDAFPVSHLNRSRGIGVFACRCLKRTLRGL